MALVSAPQLQALRTTLVAAWDGGYEQTTTWYDKVATTVPSNTANNTYGWMADDVTLRQWIGPRVAQNLSEHAVIINNLPFEGTIEIPKWNILDDNLGIYAAHTVPALARAAKKHPDVLLAALFAANPNSFDGVSFFNTAHPAQGPYGAAYSNDFAINTGGLGMTGAAINTVFANMASYRGENGLPLTVRPTLLMVPPQLEYQARTIMQSTTFNVPGATAAGAAATVDNVLKGWADILVVPELAGAPTIFYALDLSRSIRPFIYQLREAAEFVSREDPHDPKVFEQAVFTYGVEMRDNVGVSLPFLASRITLS